MSNTSQREQYKKTILESGEHEIKNK